MSEPIDWTEVKRMLVVVLEGSNVAAAAAVTTALPLVEVELLATDTAGSDTAGPDAQWAYGGDRYSATALIPQLQGHDAAIVLTAPGQSPYAAGYLCYLAGIPIRIGQSREFGGGVLSHVLPPPDTPKSLTDSDQPHPLLQQLFSDRDPLPQ